MRPKDIILEDIRIQIFVKDNKDTAPLYVQYRLIEVLLDIRDTLASALDTALALKKQIEDD